MYLPIPRRRFQAAGALAGLLVAPVCRGGVGPLEQRAAAHPFSRVGHGAGDDGRRTGGGIAKRRFVEMGVDCRGGALAVAEQIAQGGQPDAVHYTLRIPASTRSFSRPRPRSAAGAVPWSSGKTTALIRSVIKATDGACFRSFVGG